MYHKAVMGLPKLIKYVSHKVCLNVILTTRQTHICCGASGIPCIHL